MADVGERTRIDTADRLRETPLAVAFLAAIAAVYVAGTVLAGAYGRQWVVRTLAVHPARLHHAWTWVTSLAYHASALHLLANATFGYWILSSNERWNGRRHVATAFLLAGVGSSVVATPLVDAAGTTYAPMLRSVGVAGSSAALLGVLGMNLGAAPLRADWPALGREWPRAALLGLVAGISAAGAVVWPFAFPVAHVHHLVGLVVGAAYGYLVVREE